MEFWTAAELTKTRAVPHALALGYAEFVDRACRAEEMGFDGFAPMEHHFTYDSFCPAPLLADAAVVLGTKRIKLLTGAMLLPLHDPLRVAEDVATLDRISGGRVNVVLGMGYRPLEFDGLSSNKRTRGARLVEMIQFLQQVLSNDHVSFHGKYYQYDDITIRPRPVQRPYPLLWVGGGPTVKAAQRAGRAGLPYVLANSPFEHAEECVQAYRAAGRDAGFSLQVLKEAVVKDMCLARNVDEAKGLRDVLLHRFYDEHILGYGYLVDEDGNHLYNCSHSHPLYQRHVDSIFMGTPEMAIRELQRYEGLGIEIMEILTGQMDLFAKEVMPAFRR